METVIQSLLGIIVTMGLSGCLVNLPPGVEMMPVEETAKLTAPVAGFAAFPGSPGTGGGTLSPQDLAAIPAEQAATEGQTDAGTLC